jgi:hypothetical protein
LYIGARLHGRVGFITGNFSLHSFRRSDVGFRERRRRRRRLGRLGRLSIGRLLAAILGGKRQHRQLDCDVTVAVDRRESARRSFSFCS